MPQQLDSTAGPRLHRTLSPHLCVVSGTEKKLKKLGLARSAISANGHQQAPEPIGSRSADVRAAHLDAGFPDYGVSVNPAKTRMSFELRAPGGGPLPRNTVTDARGREFMPWCGLLLDVASLDLQADYTRYAGAPLASSLTIPLLKVHERMYLSLA